MAGVVHWRLSVILWLCSALPVPAVDPALLRDADALHIPTAGSSRLRILAPNLLELDLVNTKPLDPDPVESWNFIDETGALQAPSPSQIQVLVNGASVAIDSIGFKRA